MTRKKLRYLQIKIFYVIKKGAIQELHERILEKLEEERDIDEEITIVSDCVKDIGKVTFAADKWIEKKYYSTKLSASTSSKCAPDQTRLPKLACPNSLAQTRLPKLVFSSFDGDPLLFQSFWDNFEGTVHKNESFDDA